MKPISARQIAVVFTGSFLGAGFLSGQELLQFFGVFGGFGLVGMALAILAFVGFSRMVMEIAQETGRTEFDHIIVYRDLRWLRLFVEGVFLFFLFDVMVAMLAGAGALLEQVFGLRAVAGDALISLLVLAGLGWTCTRVDMGYICGCIALVAGVLKYRNIIQFNSLTVQRFRNTYKDEMDLNKYNKYVDSHF